MLVPEERALITDLQDKLIALLVEEQEARRNGNDDRARELQRNIDLLSAECQDIRRAAED